MEALRAMPSAAQEEDDEAVIARIRVLLKLAENRNKEKGFPGFRHDFRVIELQGWRDHHAKCVTFFCFCLDLLCC